MCSTFSKNTMVGKVDKVSKLESSSGNRHLRQLSGSSGISKASTSKRVSCLKESEAKKLVSRSSNNHRDGIMTITAKSPSPKSNGATLLNKNKVKPSSSNIRQNATWGSRLLCYFGWSNSKPSKPEQAIARPIKATTEVKTGEPSSKKVGKVETIMKMQTPKTSGPVNPSTRSKFHIHQPRKEPSPYNLRKKVEKSEVVKDAVVAPKRKKIVKMERPKASTVQEPVDPQGSLGIQKREIQREEKLQTSVPAVSAAPVKKIGTTKTSMQYQADPDERNHPSSSHYDPYADDYYEDAPIYHIKWDGKFTDNVMILYICLLCVFVKLYCNIWVTGQTWLGWVEIGHFMYG